MLRLTPRLLCVPALTLLRRTPAALLLARLLTPGLLLRRGLSRRLLPGLSLLERLSLLAGVPAGLVRSRLVSGLTPRLLAGGLAGLAALPAGLVPAGLAALLTGLVPTALSGMPAALPGLLP
jgi:hypothetical protein